MFDADYDSLASEIALEGYQEMRAEGRYCEDCSFDDDYDYPEHEGYDHDGYPIDADARHAEYMLDLERAEYEAEQYDEWAYRQENQFPGWDY